MDIKGYNYYGVIYIPESNPYANTVIEYNNITYEGPQMIFQMKLQNVTKQKSAEIQLLFTLQKATHHFGLETLTQVLQFLKMQV